MKMKFVMPLLVTVIIAGGVLLARAQAAGPATGPGGPGRVLQRIARQLQLTPDQRSAIKADIIAEKPALVSLFGQLRDARLQFRATLRADNATAASVRAAAANLAAAQGDMAVERLKLRQEIYPLLTPEQKQKAALLEAKLDQFGDGPAARIKAALSQ